MIGKQKTEAIDDLFRSRLTSIINLKHPLCQLAAKINWQEVEENFKEYYSEFGRPSVPVRVMVSILILKQMFRESDETVVERWAENPYWQYFSGMEYFQTNPPFDPSDFVHFRKRVGEEGSEKLLELTIKLHGKSAEEKEVLVDTTVQEKNITYPTDVKLQKKVIDKCLKIAEENGIKLRQSYRREVKQHILNQRWRNHPKNKKKAIHSARRIKVIAGRLVRELGRKLTGEKKQELSKEFGLFKRLLEQKKEDKDKLYSIHEPQTYCVAKGKEHKQYEFGSKVSVVMTKTSGIIVGIKSLVKNEYDGHTLPGALEQVERLTGRRPAAAIVDRGYQGSQQINGTEIVRAKPLPREASQYEKRRLRKRMRRRAAIEPIISHLKHDFGMLRNYLKGAIGDSINCILAAVAFNLKKLYNRIKIFLLDLQYSLLIINRKIVLILYY